ncbi:MAG TPA: tetratricopeptide repeat protein [Desulfuromonadaceae bacterium]|jgi:predicted Zn-dependent protease
MDPESGAIAEKEFQRAQKELAEGNVLAALACLERALKIWDAPTWYSFLGFCIAKERGHVTKALELCQTAIQHEPDNPVHEYFLGKVHLVAGHKAEALQALREGMNKGGTPEIEQLLKTIGMRKPPVIPFLSRDNFLNKYLGKIFGRLGLR